MLDALGPAQVAHVHQAVDPIFNLNEGSEVGQVAHPAFHDGARRDSAQKDAPRDSQAIASCPEKYDDRWD